MYYRYNYYDQKIRQAPRVTYGNTGLLFRSHNFLSTVYSVIFPTGDRTSDHRMQIRNSTTEPLVHTALLN